MVREKKKGKRQNRMEQRKDELTSVSKQGHLQLAYCAVGGGSLEDNRLHGT